MPENKITILSTRPIEESLIIWADSINIQIDSKSFIRTEPLKNPILKNLILEIVARPSTVIFTSMNAAEAVADYLEGSEPQWNIYCLGTATKKIIEQHFSKCNITGEADNASLLADEVIKDKKKSVIFFCGAQRRDELPGKLQHGGILVEEIVVYNTITIDEKIEKKYDGVLFFSPSAVKSFFSLNTLPTDTILFAIGSTTADSIKLYSNNKIIESDRPGKQNLVERSIDYFAKLNRTNEHIKK